MLYTASYYAPDDWEGRLYRVSRRHPRGKRVQWETLPFLYPRQELLLAYRSGEIDFAAFSREFRRGLDTDYHDLDKFREWVDESPGLGKFTLLCFEPAGQPCHRVAAARWLLERAPSLRRGELR
ncbi:MAG: DUF488 family protein [Dehalococcoidia bacterium]|jgi:uncharacterized protein YeaO (DUF488 family)|nr:DUF488 family protein [Dehalococcoidia bacterium]MDP7083773.1 DUF488 family protein [Dehalococcoidia bacterium]MDP7201123.1 DUF488 family protein [Dehalococcoidia bacterium]MDP7510708.1 DUF488 family protein [Dehalococcoidia bacterium]HJN87842.1 DUF488 family protein [Dehalococcoidia bacterium]